MLIRLPPFPDDFGIMAGVFNHPTPPFPMRTLIWTCVLALFFLPCVAAQDLAQPQNLAQLRKTIEDTIPAELPNDLGRGVIPPEIIAACKVVVDVANQIYALPNLDEQNRRWTMLRESFA